MKILPPITRPSAKPIERNHNPQPSTGKHGYRAYRPCLRWEFGFTCAFCLLHEADFAAHGAERLGLTWTEHFHPVSTEPERKNHYDNCFYSCCLCNRERSANPIDGQEGASLLNPCSEPWADHFEVEGNRLRPRPNDPDAAYTHRTYNLDDPLKATMRNARKEALAICRALCETGFSKIQRLVDRGDPQSLEAAQELDRCIRLAVMTLERYAAVPEDVDTDCRCRGLDNHSLPAWLDDQTLLVRVPLPSKTSDDPDAE